MKTTSELTDFYYKELYPSLSELEKIRTDLLSKIRTIAMVGGIFGVLFALWVSKHFGLLHPLMMFVLVGSIALGGILYRFMTRNYVKDFKERIITPLIHAIDPGLLYNPSFHVSQHLFSRSHLFNHSIDRYSGNDNVKGSVDGVPLEFSDVHAEYETRDSKGRTQWHTLFRGLFLVAEFNKHFKSRTVVLPDQAEKAFGSVIGGWLQSKNVSRDDLIRLDDPEFEKHFVVYGNDGIESRYILSHSMMKRLLEFQKKIPHPIHVSFVHNHIHVAISTGKDLFEPSVFRSLLEYKQAMEYIQMLRLTIGIVQELKLHEKLWSKS